MALRSKEETEKWYEFLTQLWKKYADLPSDNQRYEAIIEATGNQIGLRNLKRLKKELSWGGGATKRGNNSKKEKARKKQAKTKLKKIRSNPAPAPKEGEIKVLSIRKKRTVKQQSIQISEKAEKQLKYAEKMLQPPGTESTISEKLQKLQEEIQMPIVQKAGKYYSEDERDEVVKLICEYYSVGLYTVQQLCEIQGISPAQFNNWVNHFEGYWHQYQDAKMKYNLNLFMVLEDNLNHGLLKKTSKDRIEEVHRHYEIRLGIDEHGQFKQERILVSEKVSLKENKLDSKTLDFMHRMLNDAREALKKMNAQELDKLDVLTIEQLEEEAEQLKKMLLTERAKLEAGEEKAE